MKKEMMYAVAALLCAPAAYAEECGLPEKASGNARTIQYTLTLTRDESGYDTDQWDSLVNDACHIASRSGSSEQEAMQKVLETLQAMITTKAKMDGIGGQLTLSISDGVCNCDDDCGCKISNGVCECTAPNECTKSCAQACSQKDTTECSQKCVQTAEAKE